MSDSSKRSAAKVLKFYQLANKLKDTIRTGWKCWHVERERLESVAEHVFGVQMLAIVIWSEYHYEIDIEKVCFMLALHELEEITIGDHIPFNDISEEEKQHMGHQAIHSLLDGLLKQSEIEDIILEFDARETPDARFAYQCDKLEADLQCCLYDREGCVDLSAQPDNPILQHDGIHELYQQGLSWSKIWCENNRRRIGYDNNFLAILSSAADLDDK